MNFNPATLTISKSVQEPMEITDITNGDQQCSDSSDSLRPKENGQMASRAVSRESLVENNNRTSRSSSGEVVEGETFRASSQLSDHRNAKADTKRRKEENSIELEQHPTQTIEKRDSGIDSEKTVSDNREEDDANSHNDLEEETCAEEGGEKRVSGY